MTACENDNSANSQEQYTYNKENDEEIQTEPFSTPQSETSHSDPESQIPIAEAFLTTNPNSNPAQTQFSCEDSIYLAIKFANQEPKLQQIKVVWTDPNNTEREFNDFPFFVSDKESLAWASLKLHRSVGAGLLQWVNPAAGMEEFIGTWTVKVNVGDLLNKELNFEVLC